MNGGPFALTSIRLAEQTEQKIPIFVAFAPCLRAKLKNLKMKK